MPVSACPIFKYVCVQRKMHLYPYSTHACLSCLTSSTAPCIQELVGVTVQVSVWGSRGLNGRGRAIQPSARLNYIVKWDRVCKVFVGTLEKGGTILE